MKLPNLDDALVQESKIVDYLLSEEKSGGKSDFFEAFGFSVEQWQELQSALPKIAVKP